MGGSVELKKIVESLEDVNCRNCVFSVESDITTNNGERAMECHHVSASGTDINGFCSEGCWRGYIKSPLMGDGTHILPFVSVYHHLVRDTGNDWSAENADI